MRVFSIISFGLALAVSAVDAQEKQTPTITPPPAPLALSVLSNEPEISLEELIRRAQANSPRLTIAREGLEAARQSASASRAFLTPTLQLVPGFTGNSQARDEEVLLAQRLDVFGLRRARSQVSAAELRQAQAGNTLVERTLVIAVRNATIFLFAAQETENLAQVQVEVGQLFRDAAQRRAQLGDVPPVQVQRAELELLRLQNDLSNAHVERLARRISLNLLVGQAPATPLRVALPLDAAETALLHARPDLLSNAAANTISPPSLSLQDADLLTPATSATGGGASVSNDVSMRPDIVSAQATLEVRQAEARALRRELLPSVELQARRSAFFGRDGTYALRAVVTVPLFDFGAIKGARRAAEAQARAQAAAVKLLQQQGLAQAENARTQLEQRRQNVIRYREHILPLTLDLLRKTQIGYAQGASTYLEVLEAQRTLRQIQTEYLQALVGVQSGQTALDAALGGGLSAFEAENANAARGAAP